MRDQGEKYVGYAWPMPTSFATPSIVLGRIRLFDWRLAHLKPERGCPVKMMHGFEAFAAAHAVGRMSQVSDQDCYGHLMKPERGCPGWERITGQVSGHWKDCHGHLTLCLKPERDCPGWKTVLEFEPGVGLALPLGQMLWR